MNRAFFSTRSSLFIVVALVGSALEPAFAEPPQATATADGAKKMAFGAGLLYGLPQGDFKESSGMDLVGNSPGIALFGGYEVMPKLSVVATLRYYAVKSEIDQVDVSYWDINIGGRYLHAMSPQVAIYAEGLIGRASSSRDLGGQSADAKGFGFLAGAGGQYRVKPNVALGAGLSYSSHSLEPDQGDTQSSGWISLNAFAQYSL